MAEDLYGVLEQSRRESKLKSCKKMNYPTPGVILANKTLPHFPGFPQSRIGNLMAEESLGGQGWAGVASDDMPQLCLCSTNFSFL